MTTDVLQGLVEAEAASLSSQLKRQRLSCSLEPPLDSTVPERSTSVQPGEAGEHLETSTLPFLLVQLRSGQPACLLPVCRLAGS